MRAAACPASLVTLPSSVNVPPYQCSFSLSDQSIFFILVRLVTGGFSLYAAISGVVTEKLPLIVLGVISGMVCKLVAALFIAPHIRLEDDWSHRRNYLLPALSALSSVIDWPRCQGFATTSQADLKSGLQTWLSNYLIDRFNSASALMDLKYHSK
jgi:hypothetical protein